jgi:translation initiation factor IF-3
MGVMSLSEALRLAGEADVDLVEVVAAANPPVCRLIEYGKFKYHEQKKAAEAKSKQKVIEVKEIKFRPGTDDGDYNIKMRNIKRFLEEGDKCKITLRFRGREITHQELGLALLQRIRDELGDTDHGRAVPEAGRPADDHDDRAGPQEGRWRCSQAGSRRCAGTGAHGNRLRRLQQTRFEGISPLPGL